MCKFHKDVARDIATNPVTGDFDAGQFCVALLAMAKFRIEQYMPPMHGCDGFTPGEMTTETAVQALADSGLRTPRADITSYRDSHIDALRAAMALTTRSTDTSMAALNNPDRIVKGGYKATCCAEADPTKGGPFMDEAVVQLFGGYDDDAKTWARGDLSLLPEAHKPQFEAIRFATEIFLSQPGITETLKQMFEHSLVRVFEDAQDSQAPAVKSAGCVMCGHGSRREPKPGQP